MERLEFSVQELDRNSIDMNKLSADFVNIVTGCECPMDDSTPKNPMETYFPAATWLAQTPFARTLRDRFKPDHVTQTNDGWEMKLPGKFWTGEFPDTGQECCWVRPEFDKCCSEVPLNLLCLKDCDSMFNRLVKRDLGVTKRSAMKDVSNVGENVITVEERLNKRAFAFLTAHTAMLGMNNTYTSILKPFHGLLQVMENPAIQTLYGFDIVGVFEELGCRLDVLGNYDNARFITNPLIMRAIRAAIVPGQDGRLPDGWERNGNSVRFKGISFIEDKTMPVNLTDNTGEVWLVDGYSTGLFMATNLYVTNDFVVQGAIDTSANSCGEDCKYYFNYGTVANNDAMRMAKIVGIPIQSSCASVLGDIQGLISPQTLIPSGELI